MDVVKVVTFWWFHVLSPLLDLDFAIIIVTKELAGNCVTPTRFELQFAAELKRKR
ncbi:MAG: hypothetical protein NZ937_03260 [Armatimonadetes bacterium]|nr:hypothetical protein [Armatimonadota bacterium]